ncbi:hypothetical protein Pcinc_006813 [Petrolisthes cinctipes]|uniref:Uncharacterized protein n=1 Tax=Petrolisthes cinctipes TaxID=88211 RepID=A0AAE1GAS2_PETCI|nr:hypothetical protein Pcinc_006813 [Petrolisthes cinctipes]
MFNLEEFVANPSVGALTALHKKDWARWPPGTWAVGLLLSNVFTGEAQRAYAGLSVDESLDYATVKSTILRVYKRVPAYYRKIFRTSQKRANQTCVEFYREKLAQCQRNKLPLTQSSLKLNPNPSGPREPPALSPLQDSVSPDDSLQPSHSVTILRDSGSVRTFVLREAISSFPQCQTGHSLVVRGLFSKDQEPSEVSSACVVTRSNSRRLVKDSLSVPQVANPPPENNIVSDSPNPEFSLDEFFNSASQESNVPDQTSSSEPVIQSITDMAVTRTTLIAEQAKDPSLKNSEVLKNPGEKLAHLQEE